MKVDNTYQSTAWIGYNSARGFGYKVGNKKSVKVGEGTIIFVL